MPAPTFEKRPEFVVLMDKNGETFRINDLKELEAFLHGYTGEDLAKVVWDSLRDTYRTGVKSGLKKAGVTPTQPRH